MKRKVLALAISQLFVPCVFAQGSSVTVYGTFNVDFENIEAEGAVSDLDSRNRVQSNSSNIGFAGRKIWVMD
jgi:hypothetical protein